MTSLEGALDAVNLAMTVLIWLVQLVIYPSFRHAEARGFRAWHESYTGRISVLVVPLMFAQLGLLGYVTIREFRPLDGIALGACVAAWVATFTLSVPCHGALQERGKDPSTIERLVRTNWIRTIAWSVVFGCGIVRPG